MTWLARFRQGDQLSLLRNGVVSVAIKAAGIALVMLVTLVLARALGPAEYGRLAFMQSTAFVLASLSTLGFRESANKLVARYAARRRPVSVARFVLFGTAVVALASVLSAAAAHAVIGAFPALTATYGFPVSATIGLVLSVALLSFLAPVLVALGRPLLSFTVENIGPRVIVLIAVLGMVACGARFTANAAAGLSILGNIIPAIALAVIAFAGFGLPATIPRRLLRAARTGRAWLCVSLCMMTSPVISLVFSETAIVVLGLSASPDDVATFQIARRLAELATVCGAVAVYLALPRIAGFHTERRTDRLQQVVDAANVLTVLPGLGVLLLLLVAGRGILGLFGPAFVGAYSVMLVLSAGRVADQLFGPVLEVLLMTGQHAAASAINVAFAIGNIVAIVVLAATWGKMGVAAGTIVLTLLWKASLYAVLRARCPVETSLPLRLVRRLLRPASNVRLAAP